MALAVAVADASDSVCASISTSPDWDVTSRSTLATARSTSTVRPMPTPKPASLPAASAAALLVAEPAWLALRVSPPSRFRASPSGSNASVSFTPTVRAIAGLTATSPPEPASAVVLNACSPVALRLNAPTSVSSAPPSISARAAFTPTFSANAPPTPTLVPPVSPVPVPGAGAGVVPPAAGEAFALLLSRAVANTVLSVRLSAVSVTSPWVVASPASTLAFWSRCASVLVTPTLIANPPAPPNLPAPAPDTAVAPEVWMPSGSRPSMTASTVRPSEVMLPWTTASLVTTAALTAAATPIPMPGLPPFSASAGRSIVVAPLRSSSGVSVCMLARVKSLPWLEIPEIV